MAFRPFAADSTHTLSLRIREATLDPWGWHRVVGDIEDCFADACCRLVLRGRTSAPPVFIGAPPFQRFAARSASVTPVGTPASAAHGRAGPSTHRTGRNGAMLDLGCAGFGGWRVELHGTRLAGPLQGAAMAALLCTLAPSLACGLRLSLQLERGREPDALDLRANWDPLPYGVILLRRTLRPVFANAAGEDILSTRSLFRAGGLGAPLRPARPAFEEALEDAAHRAATHSTGIGAFTALHPDTQCRLLVRLARIGSRPVWGGRASASEAPLLMTVRQFSVSAAVEHATIDVQAPNEPRVASGA